MTLRGPTLEDVFIKITGHTIRAESADTLAPMRRWRRSAPAGRRQ